MNFGKDPCTYGCGRSKKDLKKVRKTVQSNRKGSQKVVFGSDAYNTEGIKEMADRWTRY